MKTATQLIVEAFDKWKSRDANGLVGRTVALCADTARDALKVEENQIKDAFNAGRKSKKKTADDYYNQTYNQ